jgi:F420H(2)-dependent quinone reductase
MAGAAYRPLSLFAKLFTGYHSWMYRVSGGRLGGRFGKMPFLLLTSTGSKSGQPRTTPLTYLRDGNNYVLIASNNGNDWSPAWLGNLKAHPDATIQLGKQTIPVKASVAGAEQRARLWPQVLQRYPNYAGYARKTAREIPLVILHP